ncbi:hypothetical protein [Paenibacillus sp. 19GGS1-52]|nr:hypothetical protein [Paenibacillus sp. 19GGS1-52]
MNRNILEIGRLESLIMDQGLKKRELFYGVSKGIVSGEDKTFE